ncbi:Protein of unknown function [Lactobacillus delbrueckii subsp. bulgaricus]|nr:Protein of unknown function [Lactobacillus delbrueckii subsp. bulgaricus]CDR75026.1 Protein of unknown function [Lactobacillus delbrueckii subsp. bulgaricus]
MATIREVPRQPACR